MATAQSNVFWVSYAPAEQESFEDILNLVDKVLSGDSWKSSKKHGFFAGEVLRGGRRCVDAVLCSSLRMPASAIVSATKWKRKGAKGSLADAKWPVSGEGPKVFLEKWANAMRAASLKRFSGSEIELVRILEEYRLGHRDRMRRLRDRKGRKRPDRCREPSPLLPCVPPTSPESEVSATAIDPVVVPSDGPVNEFTGIDSTLLVEGLCALFLGSHVTEVKLSELFEADFVLVADEVLPSRIPFNAEVALVDLGLSVDNDFSLDLRCDLGCNWSYDAAANGEFMPQFGADIALDLGATIDTVDPLAVFDLFV
ncbi:hypothetical protein MGU_11683 [Metarhizium guizhouense ARSEF 977]|uniref:Uncharacterized protein n=1 Tax=Metarhizium guizhouense (strain ARSEF 977) TaxID=1276136 RepID=A0A0B4GEL7_METGA|nr:hypothetical protein MGU_11683 [Metarhizium guizhouense ARSEF 977]